MPLPTSSTCASETSISLRRFRPDSVQCETLKISLGKRYKYHVEKPVYSHISWSPDGSKIAFTKIEPDTGERYGEPLGIYEVNADGSGLRERDAHYPKWRYALFSQATSIDPSSWGRIKQDNR